MAARRRSEPGSMTAKARRPPIGRSRMPTTKAATRINHHWPNPSSPPPFDSNGRSRHIHHEGSIFPSKPIVPDPRSDVDSGDTQVFLRAIIRPLMDAPDDDDADRRQDERTDSNTSSGQQRLHPRRLRWAANGGERAKDGRWMEAARRTDTRQRTGERAAGATLVEGAGCRRTGTTAASGFWRAEADRRHRGPGGLRAKARRRRGPGGHRGPGGRSRTANMMGDLKQPASDRPLTPSPSASMGNSKWVPWQALPLTRHQAPT